LARLLDQPGVRHDPEVLVRKVGSLARLALSAGVQKREFLRKHAANRPALTRAFLLERGGLVVVPTGLENVVRAITGAGLCQADGLSLGRRIVERLGQVLHEDGLACRLHVRLDSPLEEPSLQDVGLTPWDATATVKNQLKSAGVLHAVAESGTATVILAGEEMPTAEQLAEWLAWAWAQTEVVRLRWIGAAAMGKQLTMQLNGGAS
jgi:hypothetical protein